ncbi:YrhK family protein [Marinilactibacillus sp. Marseille-P9653]|uniref:YrhK family protein n=1 Tax=Marinilactibacillus sp. Marseille-P9653 TaxID=2866583 RepID=UPI001CE3B81E|nr:YrhK family protein [Marinilactibacillus sp. Marseille-P9653]
MPQIEKKEHDVRPQKDEDMIIKMGNFRLYFQNYYTIISLGNDIATGGLYLAGSLTQAFTNLERLGMYLYIFASFFLLMRPIIRIVHNVYLYSENQYRKDVLGEKMDDGYYDDSEENGIDQEEKEKKEEQAKQENKTRHEEDTPEEKEEREDADKEIEIVSSGDDDKDTEEENKKEES